MSQKGVEARTDSGFGRRRRGPEERVGAGGGARVGA